MPSAREVLAQFWDIFCLLENEGSNVMNAVMIFR